MRHYTSLVLSECLQVSLPSTVVAPKVFCLDKLDRLQTGTETSLQTSEKELNGGSVCVFMFCFTSSFR